MVRNARRRERISINPEIMGGKPCIKGTRIPVDLIRENLGEGMSEGELVEAYPGLTTDDVRAAEAWARADASAV
ncbi:MAG: DUF433 domain-containing protein, partial [Geminicoccaceae bacterium]